MEMGDWNGEWKEREGEIGCFVVGALAKWTEKRERVVALVGIVYG